MKSIKDILKTDSIKQRRKIANTLVISKEDKNALITNKSGGGGNDSNGINIEYYKVNNIDNTIILQLIEFFSILLSFKAIGSETPTHIGAGSLIRSAGESRINIFAFAFIDKKILIIEDDGNILLELEGSLQERADFLATGTGLDKINIYDYIEPITEEEFYNINV